MSLSMSSRTVATSFPHISFNTDSIHPEVVNKLPNLLLTNDLERMGAGAVGNGNQRIKLFLLGLDSSLEKREEKKKSGRSWCQALEIIRLNSF